MQVFGDFMQKQFEDRMLDHIKRYFSKQFKVRGEDQTRTMIRYGMQAATKYGMQRSCDVAGVVDLVFILGQDFESNPKYQWAVDILTSAQFDQYDKITALYDRINAYTTA